MGQEAWPKCEACCTTSRTSTGDDRAQASDPSAGPTWWGSGYGVHRCAGKSGRRRADRSRIGIRVKNPATKTALGPMVIVAVDQNENPPLIQDELAYKILPASGKVTVVAVKWRPV